MLTRAMHISRLDREITHGRFYAENRLITHPMAEGPPSSSQRRRHLHRKPNAMGVTAAIGAMIGKAV